MRWVLASVCLATATMVGFIVCTPPALPLVQRDLGTSFEGLQWIPNGYSLLQAALLVTGGALGDRLGHRRFYLGGLTGYAVALVACAAAPTSLALVLLGGLAGLVSALALGNALSILAFAFPPERRGAALAMWGVSLAAAYAIGPVAGAVVAEQIGWRAVFGLLAALSLLGSGLALVGERGRSRRHGAVSRPWLAGPPGAVSASGSASGSPPASGADPLGVVLLTIGLGAAVFALIEGNRLGWGSAAILGAVAVAVAALVAWVRWEGRAPAPLVDLVVLRAPALQAAALSTLALSAGFFAMVFYLPLYASVVLDASPVGAALRLLAVTGTCFAAALGALALRRRVDDGSLVVASLAALAAGAALTAGLAGEERFAPLLPGLVLFGWGLGTINGPIAAIVARAAGDARSGVANAAIYMCRPVGAAIGIAGLGALLPRAAREALSADAQSAFAGGMGDVFAAVAVVTSVVALVTAWLLRRSGMLVFWRS